MPTVLRIVVFRFHFYSDEYNEPPHIHVATPDGDCKYQLDPVRLAKSMNIKPHTIREIAKLVYENEDYLKEKYNEYHSH